MLQRVCWYILLLQCFVCLCACQQGQNSKKTGPVIGISFAELTQERWKRDRDYFVQHVKSGGGEVLVQDAGGDAQFQIEQCRSLALQGAQVLVVIPKNAAAGMPIIADAHRKGVKVISYDRMIGSGETLPDFFVSFDNYRIGEIQAQEILKLAPRGKYLLLGGDPADLNARIIRDAHEAVLKDAVSQKQIEIVADPFCDRWGRADATRYTEDALAKNPDLTAVVGSNDGIAAGAIAALSAKGMQGKVLVSGQDADLEACRSIARGLQTATVYKPIDRLARVAATVALGLANGQSMEKIGASLPEGKMTGLIAKSESPYLQDKVPSVLLDPIPVTKENLEATVIADGFHRKSDVFG